MEPIASKHLRMVSRVFFSFWYRLGVALIVVCLLISGALLLTLQQIRPQLADLQVQFKNQQIQTNNAIGAFGCEVAGQSTCFYFFQSKYYTD